MFRALRMRVSSNAALNNNDNNDNNDNEHDGVNIDTVLNPSLFQTNSPTRAEQTAREPEAPRTQLLADDWVDVDNLPPPPPYSEVAPDTHTVGDVNRRTQSQPATALPVDVTRRNDQAARTTTTVPATTTTTSTMAARSSGARYVPYVDTTPLEPNLTSSQPATTVRRAGFYAQVNPSILGGFDDDDDEDYARPPPSPIRESEDVSSRTISGTNAASTSQQTPPPDSTPVVTLSPPALSQQNLPESESSSSTVMPPRPAFQYRMTSTAILSDFEFSELTDSTGDTNPISSSDPVRSQVAPKSSSSEPVTAAQRSRGYRPVSNSILDDLEGTPFASALRTKLGTEGPRSTSTLATPANPFVDGLSESTAAAASTTTASTTSPDSGVVETILPRLPLQLENETDLSQLDIASSSHDDRSRLDPQYLSFGQRYQQADPSLSDQNLLISRKRIMASTASAEKTCPICMDTKPWGDFPLASVTPTCTHQPMTCLDCLEMSIRTEINIRVWDDIRCPECRERLDYVDIQRYADEATFARYEGLALRSAMSQADNFVWCTSGCGSGQIHGTGTAQPIVICLHCGHRGCFTHNVAWHDGLTCEEYDSLLADPENFRSRMEIENAAIEEEEERKQAQEKSDRAVARGLELAQQSEEVARQKREKLERERAKKAADLARKIAARRKKEEEKSQETVSRTTKPCPGCGWAIEKNSGCAHMTCIKCRHEFCWSCNGRWDHSHDPGCGVYQPRQVHRRR